MTPDKILEQSAELYKEKRAIYGDNWYRVNEILTILFKKIDIGKNKPKEWYWARLHLLVMIIVKITRFIIRFENGEHHKDSTRDLVVYAAMLDSLGDNDD